MPFPKTEDELTAAGYAVEQETARCRKCQAPIRWYRTPKDRLIPMDLPDDTGEVKAHFTTCPFADEFRRK